MNEIITLLTAQDVQRVGLVALLIFINWASASLVALMNGQFDVKKFPQFFVRDFLPFVLGFALLEATIHAGFALSNLTGAAFSKEITEGWTKVLNNTELYGVFGSLLVRYGYSTARNFATLFGTAMAKAQAVSK